MSLLLALVKDYFFPDFLPTTATTFKESMSPWINYSFGVICRKQVLESPPSGHSKVCLTAEDVSHCCRCVVQKPGQRERVSKCAQWSCHLLDSKCQGFIIWFWLNLMSISIFCHPVTSLILSYPDNGIWSEKLYLSNAECIFVTFILLMETFSAFVTI